MKISELFDRITVTRTRVCPWWLCFTFDNVFRRLIQDPYRILGPYVHEDCTALDVGPGMGYFTIPMAKMVGARGRVIAADVQEKMLSALKKRAQRAGVQDRITLHLCSEDALGIDTKVDFILTFWMVHEVPDQQRFLSELFSLLKDKGAFLLAEPTIHVTKSAFEDTVRSAERAGFISQDRPQFFMSRSVLFAKAEKSLP